MTSRSGQKIRLVKCPKCFKILQEDEDVPVYQCGGCSAILQAKRRSVTPNSAGETVEAQASGPRSEPETNIVSSSSGQDTVLQSSPGRSSDQDDEKARYESTESTQKQLDRLELSNEDRSNAIQEQECSLGDPEKNEDDDNSRLESHVMNTVAEAAGSGASSGSLSVVDHVVAARESYSSGNAEISPEKNEEDANSRLESHVMNTVAEAAGSGASSGSSSVDHVVAAREIYSFGNADISPEASPEKNEGDDNSRLESHVMNTVAEATGSGASSGSLNVVDHVVAASESYFSGNAEISPDASPVEEKQSQIDYPANKNSSAYDGSESSSDEREDQLLDENEQWKVLQKMRSGKFEMPRYPGNYKEQSASSSSTFFEKRRNGITTYSEWHQNRSLQLEGPGGRLGRQGRRHVTEQLRPDIPLYPREPYTRVSPSYLSQDEFDRYSRAHSLQMPPYVGGMNHECVDYMFHDNTRGRGRGQGSRFSGEMAADRRNPAGFYSGQLHDSYSSYSASPQRAFEQPDYYPRWSHEIVSDMEDHQHNRHHSHHRELQIRRLKERQRVAKRHVRPTAGGAPFISCYSCFENLQLPEDFLIFKRKHHLLRCGTCTTVLKFSLQSRTHLVPVARVSPLHRLMGYSTVSQVFKASQRPPSV